MLVVWSWLSELVTFDRDIAAAEAAAALTSGGLEVESITQVGTGFSGVVIAEVVAKRKHPNADKLTLVDVITEVGGAVTEVVCGAPNVPEPGGRVLWARPGSTLPSGEIGSREIKGVLSAGMLCAEDELGIGDDYDGIIVLEPGERDAALGSDPGESLGLRDAVFDIGIPANRADALGHVGIARELAAFAGGTLVMPEVRLEEHTDAKLEVSSLARVTVAEPTLCTRYTARVIDGLTLAPSPRWMRRRLELVGVRPLSNLVDITNYVMFELGQPLHAFDCNDVKGAAIDVRLAVEGEVMTTLDGIERKLRASDLLICDEGGPVALAGVMGGADSEVGDATKRVLLEAAQFDPKAVRRTSKRFDLRSESSLRFERYVDPNGVAFASARAATLLAELGGGKIAAGLVDVYPTPAEPRTLTLRASRATALTGVAIDVESAGAHLRSLGLGAHSAGEDKVTVRVPTSRADLLREVDLIEEVLRLHGFESVPATMPALSAPPSTNRDDRNDRARAALTGAGFSEAITFGFTKPDHVAALRFEESDPRSRPIAVRNPMTLNHSVMRTSLLSTLLAAVSHNIKQQENDVALFEIGSVFLGEVGGGELPAEPTRVAAVLAGRRPGHLGDRVAVEFSDLKGALDRLFRALDPTGQLDISVVSSTQIGHLHPGLAGEIRKSGGTVVGEIGEVHPEVRDAFEIPIKVFAFELSLSQMPVSGPAQMSPIPKFPAVSRDLSFFIGAEIPAQKVEHQLRAACDELLESAELLEDFRDPAHVPDGQKGMLWSLTYRSYEKTLTDTEVDASHERLCSEVLSSLSATRR